MIGIMCGSFKNIDKNKIIILKNRKEINNWLDNY